MDFRIEKIRDEEGNIWTRVPDVSDMFQFHGARKGLFDFIEESDVVIQEVTRISDNVLFEIGRRIVVNNVNREIDSFRIITNMMYIDTTMGHRIPLNEAVSATIRRRRPAREVAPVDHMPLSEIEAKILANTSPIRLERLLKHRSETLEQFLTKFFKGDIDNGVEAWNDTRNTIFVTGDGIQTEMGKRRSLGDIFMICRYYYPNCSLQVVVKLLYVTLMNDLDEGLRSSLCSRIHKRVWYYDADKGGDLIETDDSDLDEYNNNVNYYLRHVQ